MIEIWRTVNDRSDLGAKTQYNLNLSHARYDIKNAFYVSSCNDTKSKVSINLHTFCAYWIQIENIHTYYHYIEVCGLQFKGKSRIWGFALYSSESGQILFLVTPISPFVCFSEDHNVFLKFLSCLHWVT